MDPTGTKMKGLLKGLRYISQIFDNKEEEEMQIGYPTDVKHVAHIGWDGNSSSSPSWMNEFRPGTGDTAVGLQQLAGGGSVDHRDSTSRNPHSRSSRRGESAAGDGSGDPVTSLPNREARSSGRNQSTSGTADSADAQELPSEAPRHVRRHRSNVGGVMGDSESAGGAKQARRRRSKVAGGDAKGSTRSTSKLRPQASSAELGSEEQSSELPLQTAAKPAV